jgi:hypothetical protein
MARPLGCGHYIKRAVKQIPLRAPPRSLWSELCIPTQPLRALEKEQARSKTKKSSLSSSISQDEANIRDAFGLVAICWP